MKILFEWGQALLFAILFWIVVSIGLVASTCIHDWHINQRIEVITNE